MAFQINKLKKTQDSVKQLCRATPLKKGNKGRHYFFFIIPLELFKGIEYEKTYR